MARKRNETKLADLKQDPNNANRGTPEGARLLERSILECGMGRPMLVDGEGVLIAGNKTAKAASAQGVSDAEVVETDGSELVVVQRTDLSADDLKAKRLALLDNRTAQVGLSWDPEAVKAAAGDRPIGVGFTSDELEALKASATGKVQLKKPEKVPDHINVGLVRVDLTAVQIAELEQNILSEAQQRGCEWQKIVEERLGL